MQVLPFELRSLISNTLVLALCIYVGTVACSNITGETITFTREIARFLGITYLLGGLYWLPIILPLPKNALVGVGTLVFTIVSMWLEIKLGPAYAFSFLADGRTRNTLSAYKDSWDFASGKTWWKFAAVTVAMFVPYLAISMLASIVGVALPNIFTIDPTPLTASSFASGFLFSIVGWITVVWATCAWVAIVSTSAKLSTRNLEASLAQIQ